MSKGSRRDFEASKRLKELMDNYYKDLKTAPSRGQLLAWMTAAGPVELLRPFDIMPVYPENHAAMCGAKKLGTELSEVAERRGYSMDVCTYALDDLGSIYSGKSPVGGLPRPDLVFCCNNQCNLVTKWYEVLSRHFHVPMILIDAPFTHGEIKAESLDFMKEQVKEAIAQLEVITGKAFDMDRLREVVYLSKEASVIWRQIMDLASHVPSPLTIFDTFVHMAPIVTLRGTQEAIDYYKQLKEEIEDRVEKGIGALENERFRLFWDNLPIWFKLRELSEKFASMDACLVASTYTTLWAFDSLDPDDPIGSIASSYMPIFINRDIDYKLKELSHMLLTYKVDGFIMHSNRSCKPYSFGQLDLKESLTQRTGIPGLMIEADMCDMRAYSEEPANNLIDTFIGTLVKRKGNR